MKNLRLLIIVLLLVCAVIYLGDFAINGIHPFAELGAGVSCLIMIVVLIVAAVRGK